MSDNAVSEQEISGFIAKWLNTPGGAERANFQPFLDEMLNVLKLPLTDPAEAGVLGSYQYEGPVQGGSLGGPGTGRIDMYRKGSFVLEAKQSQIPLEKRNQPEMFDPASVGPEAPSGAKYDKLMRRALRQAKNYAVNLPADHPWPPFLIVCDVGRAFELHFDWSGNGRGYSFFPDKQSYRFTVDRLADREVQELFRALWLDPVSIDPRSKSAEVTRDVAKRLADVSKWLESTQKSRTSDATDKERSLAIEQTSLFLMRILFCMFAEDVGLLPKGSFTAFLEEAVEDDRHFANGLQDLWSKMGDGNIQPRYSWVVKDDVRFFNGGLFSDTNTYTLSNADKGELVAAAKTDWTKVEPAIFGTLLEQALTPEQRSQLGAHYTPRSYVERLVQATIMDVLEAEWLEVQEAVDTAQEDDRHSDAQAAAIAFHERLKALRILDPACGTGNFLYVSMELLLRLEADVLDLIAKLGGEAVPGIGPEQFFGLELNPRAAVIAELVLWIGWLRWRVNNDPENVIEPILRRTDTINFGGHAGYDAVLRRTATGEPDTENAVLPDWPEADFIVGNPPFIAGQDMREEHGDVYTEALWRANSRVPGSADFVMQWWDRAAHLLVSDGTKLRRFGFVTTNSITQEFSRRVIANYLDDGSLSLVMAIPDQPWMKKPKAAIGRRARGSGKEKGPAAVRIAMTVAEAGEHLGDLFQVYLEEDLDSDIPKILFHHDYCKINSKLSSGVDVTQAVRLLANKKIAHKGYQLNGDGFIVDKATLDYLKAPREIGKRYYIGSDFNTRDRGLFALDLYDLGEVEARTLYPLAYQYLMTKLKVDRSTNSIPYRRDNWWLFGQPSSELRAAVAGLERVIVTPRQGKHRIFLFAEPDSIIESTNVVIATSDASVLGVLSSRIHEEFSLASGGWMGVGNDPRYFHTATFDPFPFPDLSQKQSAEIAKLAEELDEVRTSGLAAVPQMSMTVMYNLRKKIENGIVLDAEEEEMCGEGRIRIVSRLHELLDEAVATAYGWPSDLPPSDIVSRLVELNKERAAEEVGGKVRWIRSDYQEPRFGNS